MSIFTDTLSGALTAADIKHDTKQLQRCEAYFRLVEEANKRTNLTRITDEADAATRHFADAIYLLSMADLPSGCRVIDIGTGAGFPGMPLALFRPDLDMTLLDASGKKTDFLRTAVETMGIDVTVLCARAEDAVADLRESFDAVISRAVASLNILTELCAPFVGVGGIFAAWKGETYRDELHDAKNALKTLGCAVKDIHPVGRGALILMQKEKPAPSMYRRRFSKIKAKPL